MSKYVVHGPSKASLRHRNSGPETDSEQQDGVKSSTQDGLDEGKVIARLLRLICILFELHLYTGR
ncbi:hypothetical protein CHS0354_026576 [Potamilus streckersoni]|uniref:Uncharacterized protein n=1 Tax=Potamilus streckersoni TaxID=2493646 RepID=A0AAE0TKE3_9BIVA|nr:hypothetical protein CHS0354_026576 [Potamilus streckersoni]